VPFYQHQFHAAETIEIAGDRYLFQPQRYALIKFGQDDGLVFIFVGIVLVMLGMILSTRHPLKRVYLGLQPSSKAVKVWLAANVPATEKIPVWFENLVQDIATALEPNRQGKTDKNPFAMDKKA
jgi:hypothetical protein